MDLSKPIEIAEDTFWVGSHLPDDIFQCHTYLIRDGSESVLIAPGSLITYRETLNKIKYVLNIKDIRYIICHHQDPDIIASLPELMREFPSTTDRFLVTHWRTYFLLKHLALPIPFYLVDQHNFQLRLESGRTLRFILTPYMHYPGNIVTYDERTKVLFSSDIFGGWMEEWSLSASEDYIEKMRPFHETYMPSKRIVLFTLNKLRKLPIGIIAPQHGSIIKGRHLIEKALNALEEFDYGILIEAPSFEAIKRMELIKTAIKSIEKYSLDTINLRDVISYTHRTLKTLFSIKNIAVVVKAKGKEILMQSQEVPDSKADTHAIHTHHVNGNIEVIFVLEEELTEEMKTVLDEVAKIIYTASKRDLYIRELEESAKIYREIALKDELIGAYRRSALESIGEQLFRDAKKSKTPLSCIMIDIDNFKHINDTYGHITGDKILQTFGQKVLSSLRQKDIFIRYGGDEFLVLLPETDIKAAEKVVERMRRIAEGIEVEGARISVSVGVTDIQSAQSLTELISLADEALYKAKRSGKNRVFSL